MVGERDIRVRTTRRDAFTVTIEAEDATAEAFTCRGGIPGLRFKELIDGLTGASTESPAVEDLFLQAMGDDEYARFRAFVDDPDHDVDAVVIADLVAQLIGAYSAFPIKLPSPSGPGQTESGDGSTDASPSPESI